MCTTLALDIQKKGRKAKPKFPFYFIYFNCDNNSALLVIFLKASTELSTENNCIILDLNVAGGIYIHTKILNKVIPAP